MELNYKDDPYSDLTPIPEDSIETSHAKQRQNGFL